MRFTEAHQAWLADHLSHRSGERRDRLDRGHRHGERLFLQNVWWPLVGHFRHLHPEYEVLDWRNRSYFADFAWLPGAVKVIFEIKGYSTHVQSMDRRKYCMELHRETFLSTMGYRVISFPYDDVEQQPELCQNLLRMFMSRYMAGDAPVSRDLLAEKEVIRLAIRLARPIAPKDVEVHFGINHRTTIHMLQKCVDRGWLVPQYGGNGSGKRIMRYELTRNAEDFID